MSLLSSRILTATARTAAAAMASARPLSRSLCSSHTTSRTRPTATSSPLSSSVLLHLSPSASSAPFSSAAAQLGSSGSLGGGKLKTHMGTKKRFFPVGSVVGMFKRGRAGKSHLNSHMSSIRRSRLRGMAITPPGQTARHLKRLLGPIL
ncbi:hypothetical protein CF326_g770 [Tilletia indica]|nr:hypothetical protein CF326_g770 [Tilletia indica]